MSVFVVHPQPKPLPPAAIRKDEKIVKRLEAILKQYHPCDLHRDEAGKMACNGGTPCCEGCRHLTDSGGGVHCVSCKFFFCSQSWAKLPEDIRIEIKALMASYRGTLRFRFDQYILTPWQFANYFGYLDGKAPRPSPTTMQRAHA